MTHSLVSLTRWRWGTIIAVLSAVLLLEPVARSASPLQETDLLIPVKTGEPPEGLAILSHPVHDIKVRVRGLRKKLSVLAKSPPPVYNQPLAGLTAGVHSLSIEKDRFVLPDGVIVVAVRPNTLIIHLEKKIFKQVPVVVSISGQPLSGFMVGDAVPVPAVVALQGPQSLLGPMEKVATGPVNVVDASEPFKQEIALDLPEGIQPLESRGVVVARISIVQKIITLLFENIAIRARRAQFPWVITPASLNLQVMGPEPELRVLRDDMDSRVYVDLDGLKPGVYVRRAVIDLPVDVKLVSAEPGLFTVTLKEK